MKRDRKDYKVTKRVNSSTDVGERWQVKAGGVLISQYQTEEEANRIADCLNKDPWYFDRRDLYS